MWKDQLTLHSIVLSHNYSNERFTSPGNALEKVHYLQWSNDRWSSTSDADRHQNIVAPSNQTDLTAQYDGHQCYVKHSKKEYEPAVLS